MEPQWVTSRGRSRTWSASDGSSRLVPEVVAGATVDDVEQKPVCEVTAPVAPCAPNTIVVAVADVEVRVAIGADVGYIATLVHPSRSAGQAGGSLRTVPRFSPRHLRCGAGG